MLTEHLFGVHTAAKIYTLLTPRFCFVYPFLSVILSLTLPRILRQENLVSNGSRWTLYFQCISLSTESKYLRTVIVSETLICKMILCQV